MSIWPALGWAGNASFFSRFLVQWLDAERTGSDRATALFWLLSLAGSVLLGTYTASRGHCILLAGFATNGVIYLRNLAMTLRPHTPRPLSSRRATLFALACLVVLVAASVADAGGTATLERSHQMMWLACAVVGQGIWGSRFALQWWYSARAGRSYFPVAFWGVSLAGNVLLLAYAIHLRDAVLTAGLLPGPLMQLRNLALARSAGDVAERGASPGLAGPLAAR
jgi:lipid-A-disaccharide synthase-like uncharacterized protein